MFLPMSAMDLSGAQDIVRSLGASTPLPVQSLGELRQPDHMTGVSDTPRPPPLIPAVSLPGPGPSGAVTQRVDVSALQERRGRLSLPAPLAFRSLQQRPIRQRKARCLTIRAFLCTSRQLPTFNSHRFWLGSARPHSHHGDRGLPGPGPRTRPSHAILNIKVESSFVFFFAQSRVHRDPNHRASNFQPPYARFNLGVGILAVVQRVCITAPPGEASSNSRVHSTPIIDADWAAVTAPIRGRKDPWPASP